MTLLTICILEYCRIAMDSFDDLLKGGFFVLISFVLSFFFSLYVLPRILSISLKKQLFDKPDARKSHSASIPRLGGLTFLPAILVSVSFTVALRYLFGFPLASLWADHVLLEFLLAIAGVVFLYLVGAKDDLVGVRYRKKFLAQFLVASLLPLSGLYINQFYGLFGLYEIPAWIGIPFSIVLVVYITNAINLIDGIDGLAAGGAILAFLVISILFLERGMYIYSMLAFASLGCLLPFFYYNMFGGASHQRKIFMGDSGSLTLGYLLAFLCVRYAMCIDESMTSEPQFILYPLIIMFIPLLDAFRVMIVRASRGQSMFIADRIHIHHKCLDAGMSHRQATCFLLFCSVLLILLSLFLIGYLNVNGVLAIDVLLFIVVVARLDIVKKQRAKERDEVRMLKDPIENQFNI